MNATKAKTGSAKRTKAKPAPLKKASAKTSSAKSSSVKRAEPAPAKKTKAAPLKAKAKVEAPKKKVAKAAKDLLDFADFPAGTVTRQDVTLCLACIFRLFTKQLGLAPRTAHNEIRRYAPTIEELTAREPERPFFKPREDKSAHCPYCDAPRRWHALVRVHRIEGGKASDAARRALVKKLTTKDEQFQIQELKKTARQIFFEWLERLGQELDFEDERAWMNAAARAYLQRFEPKTDWAEVFGQARTVRRSQRLAEGWEVDGSRLFLAPPIYNDVLLVQYLVSRSHRHGGRTFEGRLTLLDLVRGMRYGGHLKAQGITDRDQFDVLEKLVEQLTGGGDAPAKLHFIIDRRDLLDKVRDVYERNS